VQLLEPLSVSNQWLCTRSISGRESANSSAPAAASITCSECSITARASLIGLRTVLTAATAPARRVCPSMIEASSSWPPLALYTAPLPALNSGDSSITTIAATTRIEGRCRFGEDRVAGVERSVEFMRYAASSSADIAPATPRHRG
jgi:hypothetical protein